MKKHTAETTLVIILVFAFLSILFQGCSSGGSGGGNNNALSGVTTYSIYGTVATGAGWLEGVTITLSGAGSATATTDANGNYSFAGLASGSYTVTPALTGYTFNPVSKAVTIGSADSAGYNFLATAIAPPATATYGISGIVTSSGMGLQGVTMTLAGAANGSVTTDASGAYSFTNLTNGAYTITPSMTGYSFTPSNSPQTVNGADVTGANFSATGNVNAPMSLSGTVAVGSPLSGVTVTAKDANGTVLTVVTGDDGAYSLGTLTLPILLKTTMTTSEGDRTFYSIATSATATTANVHPFTDLIVRNWYTAQGENIDTLFDAPGPMQSLPANTDIGTIELTIRDILIQLLQTVHLDATQFNLITTPFSADGTGFDNILDRTDVNIASGITVTAVDPNTGSDGNLLISAPLSTTLSTADAINGVNTMLLNLTSTLYSQACTTVDLDPYLDGGSNYVDEGVSAAQLAQDFSGIVGCPPATVSAAIDTINSYDSVNHLLNATIAWALPGQFMKMKAVLRFDGTHWLIHGDGVAQEVDVTSWGWKYTNGLTWQYGRSLRFEVASGQTMTINSVVVTGPSLSTPLTVPMVCDIAGGPTGTLPTCGNAYGWVAQNGRAFQYNWQGFLPPIGSIYTLALTPTSGPTITITRTVTAEYGFDTLGNPVDADYPNVFATITSPVSSSLTFSNLISNGTSTQIISGSVFLPAWISSAQAPHFNFQCPNGNGCGVGNQIIDGSFTSNPQMGQYNNFTITIPPFTVDLTGNNCGGPGTAPNPADICVTVTNTQGSFTNWVQAGWIGSDANIHDLNSSTNGGVQIQ